MDNLDKYFEEIIEKISRLQKENNLDDALEILEQELHSSYIPLKYIQTLEQMYVDISNEQTIKNIKQKYNAMSKTEMLGNIYKNNKLDLNVLSYFLSKFYKEIDSYDLQYLNKIFLDKNISNNEKIFILNQLKIIETNYDFEYLNINTNDQFKINPISNFEIQNHTYYKDVLNILERELMKEPSLILLSKDLLQIIYEYFFNKKVSKFNSNELASNLINYVKKHFDDQIKINEEFKT
jgi:hypothetical protein